MSASSSSMRLPAGLTLLVVLAIAPVAFVFCARPGPDARREPTATTSSAAASATATAHVVRLRADGTRTVNGEPYATDDAIVAALRRQSAGDPNARAHIEAAPSTPYAQVIHAMDLARQAGIQDVGALMAP